MDVDNVCHVMTDTVLTVNCDIVGDLVFHMWLLHWEQLARHSVSIVLLRSVHILVSMCCTSMGMTNGMILHYFRHGIYLLMLKCFSLDSCYLHTVSDNTVHR